MAPAPLVRRTKKIGPGHYLLYYAATGPKGGRIPGTQPPVPKKDRDPRKAYCECGRRLNLNNRSGTCRTCSPHGHARSSGQCLGSHGHRWRTIRKFGGRLVKQCIHCGATRPFTDKEIAEQRRRA